MATGPIARVVSNIAVMVDGMTRHISDVRLANAGNRESGDVLSCTKQQSQAHEDIEINRRSDNADEDADANRVVDGENAEEGESPFRGC